MADGVAAPVEEETVWHIQRAEQGAAGWPAEPAVQWSRGVCHSAGAAKDHPSGNPHPEAVRQREGRSAGQHPGGVCGAPAFGGGAGVPTVRQGDA